MIRTTNVFLNVVRNELFEGNKIIYLLIYKVLLDLFNNTLTFDKRNNVMTWLDHDKLQIHQTRLNTASMTKLPDWPAGILGAGLSAKLSGSFWMNICDSNVPNSKW